MKSLKIFHIFIIILFLLSLGTLIYNYSFQEIPYTWIINCAYGICGISISYDLIFRIVNKNEKKLAYL